MRQGGIDKKTPMDRLDTLVVEQGAPYCSIKNAYAICRDVVDGLQRCGRWFVEMWWIVCRNVVDGL